MKNPAFCSVFHTVPFFNQSRLVTDSSSTLIRRLMRQDLHKRHSPGFSQYFYAYFVALQWYFKSAQVLSMHFWHHTCYDLQLYFLSGMPTLSVTHTVTSILQTTQLSTVLPTVLAKLKIESRKVVSWRFRFLCNACVYFMCFNEANPRWLANSIGFR